MNAEKALVETLKASADHLEEYRNWYATQWVATGGNPTSPPPPPPSVVEADE